MDAVGPEGFEPPTSCASCRSIPVYYDLIDVLSRGQIHQVLAPGCLLASIMGSSD